MNIHSKRPGYIDPMTWNNYVTQVLDEEVAEAMKMDNVEILDDIAGYLFAGKIGYMGKLPRSMGGWSEWEKRLTGAVYVPGEGIYPGNTPNAFEGLGFIIDRESYHPKGKPVLNFPGTTKSALDPRSYKRKDPFIQPEGDDFYTDRNSFQRMMPQIQGIG